MFSVKLLAVLALPYEGNTHTGLKRACANFYVRDDLDNRRADSNNERNVSVEKILALLAEQKKKK